MPLLKCIQKLVYLMVKKYFIRSGFSNCFLTVDYWQITFGSIVLNVNTQRY